MADIGSWIWLCAGLAMAAVAAWPIGGDDLGVFLGGYVFGTMASEIAERIDRRRADRAKEPPHG